MFFRRGLGSQKLFGWRGGGGGGSLFVYRRSLATAVQLSEPPWGTPRGRGPEFAVSPQGLHRASRPGSKVFVSRFQVPEFCFCLRDFLSRFFFLKSVRIKM